MTNTSKTESLLQELRADLTEVLGVRAPEALKLLQRRDGADRPEVWRAGIVAHLERCPGFDADAALLHPGVHPDGLVRHNGKLSQVNYLPRTERESVLLWLQEQREKTKGFKPESFSKLGLWQHARGYFEAGIKRLLEEAGVPKSAWEDEATAYKKQLHPEFTSSTALPPSEFLRRIDGLFMDLMARGAGAVREAWMERVQAKEAAQRPKTAPKGYVIRCLMRRGLTKPEATNALDTYLPGRKELSRDELHWLFRMVGVELELKPAKRSQKSGRLRPTFVQRVAAGREEEFAARQAADLKAFGGTRVARVYDQEAA